MHIKKLVSTRKWFTDTATLSELSIVTHVSSEQKSFGYVVEDVDRGLHSGMSLKEISSIKVHGKTAIPTGTYKLGVMYSPKHKRDVLFLENVPGFKFIELHNGNTAEDTEGCQIVGLTHDTTNMTVGKSIKAVTWLENELIPQIRIGEEVFYEITKQRV